MVPYIHTQEVAFNAWLADREREAARHHIASLAARRARQDPRAPAQKSHPLGWFRQLASRVIGAGI